jgi:homopolymeric O-antigen transport system ATP-binding protein
MKPAITVTNLSKSFRRYSPHRPATIQEALARGIRRLQAVEQFWGLRDVSFQVSRAETVGLLGANGSSKSTLLRLIGGVGRPDGGSVEVNGRIGALLNLSAGFHPDLTGRENAILAGVLSGLTRRQALDRFDSMVSFAEVEKFIDNPVRTYSTGMQMRLAFAAAVHADPEILLIDEVLSVGDLAFQRKCLDRIARFKANGCSILIVSHDVAAIQNLCDEALWLSSGRLMAQGPPAEVVAQYIAHMAQPAPQYQPS